jgi:hypothetical protein
MIPLVMSGILSGFQTYMPTQDELDNLPRVVLTANAEWDPHFVYWARAEGKQYYIKSVQTKRRHWQSPSVSNRARTAKAVYTC